MQLAKAQQYAQSKGLSLSAEYKNGRRAGYVLFDKTKLDEFNQPRPLAWPSTIKEAISKIDLYAAGKVM